MVVFILPTIILLLKMLFGKGEKAIENGEKEQKNDEKGKTSDEPEEEIDDQYCDDKAEEVTHIQEESDEPVAAPEPPRPAILNGTNVSTKQYIDMLYKIMIPLCAPKEDVNKDVELLQPQMSIALIKVLNYLDPRSFLRVSATCKDLREICLNSKQIQIPCPQMDIKLKTYFTYDSNKMEIRLIHRNNEPRNRRKVIIFGPMLKKVKQLPFLFNFVIRGKGGRLSRKHLNIFHRFLHSFRFCTISRIDLDMWSTVHWQGIIDIIKEYDVPNASFWKLVPSEFYSQMLNLNVKELTFLGAVDVALLQNVSFDSLTLLQSEFSVEDVGVFLQMWMRKRVSIGNLEIGCSFDQQALMTFLRGKYTVIPEHEEQLPEARPVIVASEEDDNFGYYWLLTEDKNILEMNFYGEDQQMHFNSKSFFDIPDILAEFI